MEKYAGFWIRFVASTVDGIIVSIGGAMAQFIISIVLLKTISSLSATIIGGIIPMIGVWLYYILMTQYKGATLGKMLVGITVKSEDGITPLTFWRLVLREVVGKFVSSIILGIGYIMAAFTEKKQGLHDMMAKTVVVYKDPANPNKTGLVIGIIIAVLLPIIAIVGILSSVVLMSLSTARGVADEARVKSILNSTAMQMEVDKINVVAYNCIDSQVLTEMNVTCFATDKTYALSAPLKDGSSYCVDSKANKGLGEAEFGDTDAHCAMK